MANPLQDCRAAVDWAASGQVIEIAEKIAEFKRLSSIIEADLAALDADRVPTGWRDTAVRGRLEFGFADERQEVPEVRCRLTANVDAVCQRCLQAFKLRLATEMNMLLLVFGQNVEGYEDYEVWELEDRTLRPHRRCRRTAGDGTCHYRQCTPTRHHARRCRRCNVTNRKRRDRLRHCASR